MTIERSFVEFLRLRVRVPYQFVFKVPTEIGFDYWIHLMTVLF